MVRCVCLCVWTLSFKQGGALTGRNRTGPPCSVSRLTANAPGLPARQQRYRRRQTMMTTASKTILAH